MIGENPRTNEPVFAPAAPALSHGFGGDAAAIVISYSRLPPSWPHFGLLDRVVVSRG